MKVLEKYDGTKTYMFYTGRLATPEVIKEEYPASELFTHVVETDVSGEVFGGFYNLSSLRSVYEIDLTLSEDEAISAIETIFNTVPEVSSTPTAEERTAAALEFLALSSLPTV